MLRALLLGCVLVFPVTVHAAVFYPTSYTLDNGLQLIVVPNHLAPAVNQMVWYKVGSGDEDKGKTGLAHYLEHLMFRGTTSMAPGEFSKMIAAQGGNDNAFTSYDYTAYHETVAADRLPMIMQMEADRMQNLVIKPETALPELNVVLSERQQRTDNSPTGRFSEKVRSLLLPNHPYGAPVIGWKTEIEKLDAAKAAEFYQRHYAPNNAVVVVSGDVTPEEVKGIALATFGKVAPRDIPKRKKIASVPVNKQKSFSMVDARVQQPQLVFNAVVPSYTTQKKGEAYAYEVLAQTLGGGEVGVLYRHLVKVEGLASGVDAGYDGDARGDAIFSIGLTPNPGKDIKQLEKALRKELKRLAESGIDDATIVSARERLKRAAIFARDSLMMPGYSFGMALATGGTVEDVEAWPERIEAVTPKDVNAALKSLIANPRHIMASLLPDPKASEAHKK
ncbi:MAG: pitrilysin family protein [Alphaproteobacteria bacterium]